MLKKLQIENFQSHKNTVIDFTEGLNVIIGESDGGKSSIIRALSAVCYNAWDSDSMRVGQHNCKITLQTDKGIVILTKDTKSKTNSYCGVFFETGQQFNFESVGTTVPQIVNQITGMQPLKIADSAVDIPNIMYQLDKHYMLAQVSGKTCTSNLIARIFDKVIGLGGMQELISQISSSMINDKKQITKKMALCDQLKLEKIDQLQLLQTQVDIQNSKKNYKTIQFLQNQNKKIDQILYKNSVLQSRLATLSERDIQFDDVCANKLLLQLNSLVKKVQIVDNYLEKYINANNELNIANQIIEKYSDLNVDNIEEIKSLCNKIYLSNRMAEKYRLLVTEKNKCKQIIAKYENLKLTDTLLDELKVSCNKLYKIDKMLFKLTTKEQQILKLENQICDYEASYCSLTNKMREIKKNNKICPICGKTFDECGE